MNKNKSEFTREQKEQKSDWDKKEEKGEKIVKEKERAADVMGNLQLKGTQDLINQMKGNANKLESRINQMMKEHKSEHDTKANEAKGVESEVKTASDASKDDSEKLKGATGQMMDSDVKNELQKASENARQDSEFLNNIKEKRKTEREKSQTKTQNQLTKVQNKKVTTKK